nr:MAG TPA: hypothetical protein [Caudoviricetes sp.]
MHYLRNPLHCNLWIKSVLYCYKIKRNRNLIICQNPKTKNKNFFIF